MAAHCGLLRNLASIIDGRKPAYGFDDEDLTWGPHIEGACGEVAVAKLLDKFWSPTVNTFGGADIGRSIGVRTRSKAHYDLIVREADDPNHKYILVTGRAPKFTVHGYIIGSDARKDDWVHSYGGRPAAWFVPQSALRSIDELKQPPAAS